MWLVYTLLYYINLCGALQTCGDLPSCTLLPWSEWDSCSATCGNGLQTRTREICRFPNWSDDDYKVKCGGKLMEMKETRQCKEGCLNGGTITASGCVCGPKTTGTCCEKEMVSQPYSSKRQALSFLGRKRFKRDDHIAEECRESGGCDHEEVEEWIDYKNLHISVCDWMRDTRCKERRCSAGTYCSTTHYDCDNLRNYHVGCFDINECSSNPCMHGGTCHNLANAFGCSCTQPYYGTRCEISCHKPQFCQSSECTNSADYKCTKCVDEGSTAIHSIYWLMPNHRGCDATCSWKQNWCWPGICTGNLAKNCKCTDGFVLSASDNSCQPSKKPDLVTCRLGAENSGGEVRNSSSGGSCIDELSNYMKFQPASLSFVFEFELTINVSTPKPIHIKNYSFGVVASNTTILKRNINDDDTELTRVHLSQSNGCSKPFTDINPFPASPVTCKKTVANSSGWNLNDGEQICVRFTAFGGGFFEVKDFNNTTTITHTYSRTTSSHEVCMRYDSSPPVHCIEKSTCLHEEHILLENRITKLAEIEIDVTGWFDPFPKKQYQASGIKSYLLTVHDTKEVDKNTLIMDEKSLAQHNMSRGIHKISLPNKQPALYGLSLGILDNAGNFKKARRFVIYDNSSKLLINHLNHLKVFSGNKKTNNTWQTNHGDICTSWKSRYYNSYNINYNLLRQIKPDYHRLYTGVYDQTTGQLPICGTPNVDGITEFWYLVVRDSKVIENITLSDLSSQKRCNNYDIKDGDTYDITVFPVDIIGNTLHETTIIHIDASVPDINEIYLVKDGVKQLFVHNSTELSIIAVEFETLDPHSGLHSIEWILGTTLGGGELGKGAIAIDRLEKGESCRNITRCYCPSVGVCEKSVYSVGFNSLKVNNTNNGNHNREYFFTVKVTNIAQLVSIARMEILIDDSPPEIGVVAEGYFGDKEVDFASGDSIIIRWSGFVDHESGIRKYRVGFSDKCLSKSEMLHTDHSFSNHDFLSDTEEISIKLQMPKPGKYYATVLAYNNALESSNTACSDGVTFDNTPPLLNDIIIHHVKTKQAISCSNGTVLLTHENVSVSVLQMTETCQITCNNSYDKKMLKHLKLGRKYTNNSDYSDAMCQRIQPLQKDFHLYLPSDKLFMSWNVTDIETQIRNVFIGIASTNIQTLLPDITSYVASRKISSYTKLHTGIDAGTPFFVMLKIVNKADLETVVPIGPIIIDETPPLYIGKVNVTMDKISVYVLWSMDTFLETEQREPVNTVLFRLGRGSKLLTPFLQGIVQHECGSIKNTNLSCIKYPLRRVQAHDTGKGTFYFELNVYNTVGHFVTIQTNEFSVPSRFPPGHGTVLEISPEASSHKDIDFIDRNGPLCIAYFGFQHHEKVDYEIALSTDGKNDDVIAYSQISHDQCIYNISTAPRNILLYTLLKATCSGGNTVSSSDGFYIIDQDEVSRSFFVADGIPCRHAVMYQISFVSSVNTNISFEGDLVLHEAYTLTLNISESNISSFNSSDIIWRSTGRSHHFKRRFIPLVHRPTFDLSFISNFTNNSILATIELCNEDARYQTSNTVYSAYWETYPIIDHIVTHYRVGLSLTTNSSDKLIVPISSIGKASEVTIRNLVLLNNEKYRVSLQPCFGEICILPIMSRGSVIQYTNPLTSALSIAMDRKESGCSYFHISFAGYRCGSIDYASSYDIRVVDATGRYVTGWHSLKRSANDLYSIKESLCLHLSTYSHKTLSACVRGTCSSGMYASACSKISPPSSFHDSTKTIYEVNADSPDMNEIRLLVHSRYLGEKLSILHDNEVDIVLPKSKIYGVLLYEDGRRVHWFLMKTPHVPTQRCGDDTNCLQDVYSTDGIGAFSRKKFESNKKYYICAMSNKTEVRYEKFSELKDEFELCGNGFIVDDSKPTGGVVSISTDFGNFVTNGNQMTIKWSGFRDIESILPSEISSGISTYQYCIGTFPGGQDLVPYQDVGFVKSAFATNFTLKSSRTYFASVKAIDHVGHYKDVTSAAVMFDDTPPSAGKVFIGDANTHQYITSGQGINIRWDDFHDDESGIQSFRIGIGSSNVSADTLAFKRVDGQYWKTGIEEAVRFTDGHQYYALILVTNNAGLTTISSSLPFIVDNSPPVEGIVCDGHSSEMIEVDFQINTTVLCANWKGFNDPHSNLAYFEAGIGTGEHSYDVFPANNLGLINEYCWTSLFTPGIKYFVTIKSCNRAGLCIETSSDGVILDNSPPVPGIIHVGLSDRHESYISHSSMISAQWIGFQDPHSGLSHFEWCLGSEGKCDILQFENVLLSKSVTKTNIHLPNNTDMYITVRSFNRVCLYAERTSRKFRIDITPPVVVLRPFIDLSPYSHRRETQFDNSVLALRWRFDDFESPILENEITVKSHDNGKTIENVFTNGNENGITITFENENLLRNGDMYFVCVTSCNAAGLCTQACTDKILIDSSPPHLGGFYKSMTWKTINHLGNESTQLNLRWYGFSDIESGIERYGISVSRNYSGSELSGGIIYVDNTKLEVNTILLNLTGKISATEQIILAIFAYNNAGLRSETARVTVVLVPVDATKMSGFLELQRHSCDAHYCNNDCTCAVVGKKCIPKSNSHSCTLSNATANHQTVFGKLTSPIKLTLSKSCLYGSWTIEDIENILRFEWSMGIEDESPGAGIFNLLTESIWYDNDKFTNITYCLKNGRRLKHGTKYVLYVRVWLSDSLYLQLQSSPVLVDLTAPVIKRGKSIWETQTNCNDDDIDFIDTQDDIHVCWSRVFIDSQSKIIKYTIIGGLSPFGDDFLLPVDLSLRTMYIINGSSLEPGLRYYFTVTAVNELGLETSHVSDGILLDLDQPSPGVVYNTHRYRNVLYQPSLNTIGISWHGFDDCNSYIKNYHVQITDKDKKNVTTELISADTDTNLKLHSLNLQQNKTYQVSVTGFDAVGHSVGPIYADEIHTDVTPPVGIKCTDFKVFTTTFYYTYEHSLHDIFEIKYESSIQFQIHHVYKVELLTSLNILSKNVVFQVGNQIMLLRLKQNANGTLELQHVFLATFDGNTSIVVKIMSTKPTLETILTMSKCSSVVPSENPVDVKQISSDEFQVCILTKDMESGIKSIDVGAGTTNHGYQIRSLRPFTTGTHGVIRTNVPHRSTIYLTVVVKNNAGLVSTFETKGLKVDHSRPIIRQISANVKTSTAVLDNERDVIVRLEDVLLNLTNHNESIHFEEHFKNITVSSITMKWMAFDNESEVIGCECSAGFKSWSQSVQKWTPASDKQDCHFSNLRLEHGAVVYVSVRCTNNVQLQTTKTHGPIIVSFRPPDEKTSQLNFLLSNLYSNNHDVPDLAVQSNTSQVTFCWDQFLDKSDIREYEVRVITDKTEVMPWRGVGKKRCQALAINGRDTGVYIAEVRAVNFGNVTSLAVNHSLYLDPVSPRISGSASISKSERSEYIIDWRNVFTPNKFGHLVYEVSVGSNKGYSDILPPLTTLGHSTTVQFDPEDSMAYVVITAITPTGEFATYQKSFYLQ